MHKQISKKSKNCASGRIVRRGQKSTKVGALPPLSEEDGNKLQQGRKNSYFKQWCEQLLNVLRVGVGGINK